MYGLAKIANDFSYRDAEISKQLNEYRNGINASDPLKQAEAKAKLFNYIRSSRPKWDGEKYTM